MLAGTLAALATLASRGAAALATHSGLILAHGSGVVLAVLASVATVTTSIGHFIFNA